MEYVCAVFHTWKYRHKSQKDLDSIKTILCWMAIKIFLIKVFASKAVDVPWSLWNFYIKQQTFLSFWESFQFQWTIFNKLLKIVHWKWKIVSKELMYWYWRHKTKMLVTKKTFSSIKRILTWKFQTNHLQSDLTLVFIKTSFWLRLLKHI